jgi:O-antigen/teichoic acid export membrane protein
MKEPQEEHQQNLAILRKIVIGLLLWGLALSIGAYVFRSEHDYRKPLVIMGCVLFFVSFWSYMLWSRQRRLP